jgi:Caspase domain
MSGHRLALIIANDEYEQAAMRNLLAPRADAEALGRVLGDPEIGHFLVHVVRNEPSYVIQAKIEELFSESRPDDLLLLHVSGYGLKSESGELFFAASNTRPSRLESTAVSADFVQRCMRASRSRSVVLLLDCSYDRAFDQGVTVQAPSQGATMRAPSQDAPMRASANVNVLNDFPPGKSGSGRGRAIITASNVVEYALGGDQLAEDQRQCPSVFTSALVEGLATGDADRDEDGWISLNELYDYVFGKIQEQNPHQTPSRHFELEGELYLARSRRRRIRPAPIPPDLQAALSDPNMYTRRGAVSELQARLASDDLPVAAGAYQALAELAHTDIQYVAEPAAAALRQAAVRPEETELHFGRQQQGSAAPHRLVRLLGPHIARACTLHASDDWIRVNATPEGFDVAVDTTRTGSLRGSIDLKGLTGEAVIAIDAEILPRAAPASTIPGPSRPASQSTTPVAVPVGQPEEVPTAKKRQKAPQGAWWEAVAQGGQDAAEATQPRAAMPQWTAPAAPSAARSITYDELAARARAQLVKRGRLLFNPPKRMQLGETERVEVRLIRTLKLDAKLLESLRGHGAPQLEEISTAPLMSVTLKSDGFNITAYSDEEQSVVQDRPTTWEFDIRALKRGPQRLVMCVNMRIPVPGAPLERISEPVREKIINVQVGTVALAGQFVSSHWAWLVGTVIAIVGLVVAILH